MQALVLSETGLTLDGRYAEPAPAEGEVLIRPTRMGVCSTDLELCKGYMGFAGVLGHEFVGVVEKGSRKWRDKYKLLFEKAEEENFSILSGENVSIVEIERAEPWHQKTWVRFAIATAVAFGAGIGVGLAF